MADAGIDFLKQWALLAIRQLQPNANSNFVSEEIRKCTGRIPANIYITLNKLEKEGYIKRSLSGERTITGRPRKQPKILSLTEKGRLILDEWIRSVDSFRRGTKKSSRK